MEVLIMPLAIRNGITRMGVMAISDLWEGRPLTADWKKDYKRRNGKEQS